MAAIVIDDVRYPFPENLTFREMLMVKRLTGLRAGEIADAFLTEEPESKLAFAAIALVRAGQPLLDQEFLDRQILSITFDWSEETAADAGPPAGAGGKRPRARR